MTFAEKLKSMRKQSGMSQEKLAEKIGVSRQAITKWENNTGIPDIENMLALSSLFNVSVDELLSNEKIEKKQTDYLYESVTEYDIDNIKRYDMNLGGANTLVLSGYEGEKIRVRLASNTLATLQSDFKVKIDDSKNHIDIDISRKNGMTEANAKEQVMIFVQLPSQYIDRIEASINAGGVEVKNLNCENLELETKTHNVIIDGFVGTLEIDCNLDMDPLRLIRFRQPQESVFPKMPNLPLLKRVSAQAFYMKWTEKRRRISAPQTQKMLSSLTE